MDNYLRQQPEPVPHWLMNIRIGQVGVDFNPSDFFASRIVFYPGSGSDGQPVQLFGSTHSAHCFVYADYGLTEEQIDNELQNEGFWGYGKLCRVAIAENQLTPGGWVSHLMPGEIPKILGGIASDRAQQFGFLEILEREDGFDHTHGAERLAILFLGADGVATFDALFCQQDSQAPFAVVLQDHGFGGNYTEFGRGGLLDEVSRRSNCLPQYLLYATGSTVPWEGYDRVEGLQPVFGGMWNTRRELAVRTP